MNHSEESLGVSRRQFMGMAATAGVALTAFAAGLPRSVLAADAFTAPALPYAENALEPYISARTVSFHYGKHTMAYFKKTNAMLANSPKAGSSLEEVFKDAAKDAAAQNLFNNAAQAWNHVFYWQGMKPGGGGPATGDVAKMIKASFGNYDSFKKAFAEAGATQFGSGWAWLVLEGEELRVVKTPNAMNPMVAGAKPLLTMDVWEHAYYLDYQNRRGDYISAFLDHLVNWDFVNANLA
ncbi:superoxide dismutase [Desulfovibrio inopinatus]|uniref:superoxide dismutase n=1 Tax=Desulfovibrio inopinatus TaxID=102109 RepID=UPI00042673C1|nr:superoxide dismutase [Desulfovibrio inopinatus]